MEDPKYLKGALAEEVNFRGPALVNVVISQGSARKPRNSAGTTDGLTGRAAPLPGAAARVILMVALSEIGARLRSGT